MTQTPETPESLGLRLLEMANRSNCPQNEALALIAAGADVHVKDENGDTALHRAASRGHTAGDTAEMLMHGMKIPDLADRIRAANLERATREFREGLKHALPTPAPLHIKKRSLPP